MLKRLELVGFKSFADKTEFEFAPGVTGIVGPNGSGKSNVVDAVRWVLGEQSAKSLRGGEMTDVIFNGSATRRSLGLAEVTMTFDNSRRVLATEADEVQIGRRVYRSGEGEYLINGQVCRLKDIKDLFLGSGAGTDAYCIIEQGRVDVLLQASTKERRTIFEEAAGISRFKAKKTETLRRLERVDQNLQRLQGHRRRGGQAAAQREAAGGQGPALPGIHGPAEGAARRPGPARIPPAHGVSGRENAGIRGAARRRCGRRRSRPTPGSATCAGWRSRWPRLDAAVREQEADLSAARQQIAAEETTLGHGWAQADDLEERAGADAPPAGGADAGTPRR